MSDTDSSSSSSSSSSSDDDSSVGEQLLEDTPKDTSPDDTSHVKKNDEDVVATTNTEKNSDEVDNDNNIDLENRGTGSDDSCKVFLSRIPQTFDNEIVKRILEEQYGDGSVVEVSIVYERTDEDGEYGNKTRDKEEETPKPAKDTATEHRGFGFATFSDTKIYQSAIDAGTIRGSAKSNSKRKHTLYIRPVVREEEGADSNFATSSSSSGGNRNICFLWTKSRCPYGDGCKFVHEGPGGLLTKVSSSKKKQKCFAFKKTGKCKMGDDCPYSHDIKSSMIENKDICKKVDDDTKKKDDKKKIDKSQKDCINWKNKGKCRKGDKCPFKHDEAVRNKVLAKKNKNAENNKQKKENKERHPLSIRVFGLNYDTKEEDIREFFQHCGPIMEITFPTFEDSGRSKGYCGVLFQSPKAVEKAVELDGSELHGRWLQIQAGKMFLRKWEEVEKKRKDAEEGLKKEYSGGEKPLVGEYGQPVKKRKKHGFKD